MKQSLENAYKGIQVKFDNELPPSMTPDNTLRIC